MNLRNIDIFSPLVIVGVIFCFLVLAQLGIYYGMMGLKQVSSLTYIYIIFGVSIFIIGVITAKIIEKKIFKKKNYKKNFNTLFDRIDRNRYFTRRVTLFFVFLPLILQLINLYMMDGIPLFSGILKAQAFNGLTVISFIIFLPAINILIAKFYKKRYFLIVFIGVLIFAATGYRATTLAIVLSILITTYYINDNRFRYFLIITPIILILGLILGYITCMSIEWQNWHVNPLSLIFIRAGYTLTVLDKIIHLTNPQPGLLTYTVLTGFFTNTDPRFVLGGFVFNYDVSITSTIFGMAILELGFIGLGLQMFFIGLVLELFHIIEKVKKGLYTAFYAIGIAQTIIWVETGPMDLAMWIYYLLIIILLIQGIIRMNNNFTKESSSKG
ncbi:MAG: oligosaccharide repeat unit polymerase family protein [Methanobacteriaceae archaeon]|nr:oligosaccharide repeat unit polymerase family protein [Methanobacteriaceae archaeon]